MTKVMIDTIKVKGLAMDKAETSMRKAINYVWQVVDNKIRQRGTGRVYRRGGISHQASSPGQPPATDTGALRLSMSQEITREGGDVVGRLTANSEYALALEKGTSKMAARPFLIPSLEQSKAVIRGLFK